MVRHSRFTCRSFTCLIFEKTICMEALQELKQELIETIAGLEDYDMLLALKEDVALYQKQATEDPYDFPGATEEEREELIRMDKEGDLDESDTISFEEFKATIKQWRTHS